MESRCGILCSKCNWKQTEKCKGCANSEVEDDLLKDLLDKSYNLVLGGFSKKKQKEILESGDAINGI